MNRQAVAVLVFVFGIASDLSLSAAEPAAAVPRRVVDSLLTVENQRLWGMLFDDRMDQPVRMVLSREWLVRHYPQWAQQAEADEKNIAGQSQAELKQRVQTWLTQRKDQPRLAFFLEKQLASIEEQGKKAAEPPPLLMLEIPRQRVRRVYVQPVERRSVLLHAWRQNLKQVEERSLESLLRELKTLDISVDGPPADAARMIASQPQTARQWAARVALVEFQFLGGPTYQGTGGLLFQDKQKEGEADLDNKALQDNIELLGGLLGQNLGELFEGLDLNPTGKGRGNDAAIDKAALKKAQQETAAAEGLGFRVLQLEPTQPNGMVGVRGRFFALMPDGDWSVVWESRIAVSPRDVPEDLLKTVQEDPRVKQITELFTGLGLGGGGNELETALRHGAATLSALRQLEGQFNQFLNTATENLDAPPLMVSPAREEPEAK